MCRRVLAWTAVAVIIGCPLAAQTVRDSAGIQIVANTDPVWRDGAKWTVEHEPHLEIGLVDGAPEYQLFRARYARRLTDGTIVFANTGTLEVRGYETDGKIRFNIGGAGGGPGEFRDIHYVGVLPGDTLLVHDRDLNRLSFFSREGGFLGSQPFPALPNVPGAFPWVRGIFSSGDLLVQQGHPFAELADGIQTATMSLGISSRAGEIRAMLGEFPYGQYWVETEGNRRGYLSLPFGRSSDLSVSGRYVFVGWNDHFVVDVYDVEGKHVRSIRRGHKPEAVKGAEIQSEFEKRFGTTEGAARTRIARLYRDLDPPETKPAHGSLVADRQGNLWVQNYESDIWSVFSIDGHWLGDVEVPDLNVTEIGEDYVLGFHRGPLGVQRLRLYDLRKPST